MIGNQISMLRKTLQIKTYFVFRAFVFSRFMNFIYDLKRGNKKIDGHLKNPKHNKFISDLELNIYLETLNKLHLIQTNQAKYFTHLLEQFLLLVISNTI